MERKLTEEMIDTYIAQAMENPGAAVAEAPAEGRRLQRDLRETVARLGAASPYMQPPEELRARVLQATAPASFKMEDYRKATRENSRYYKWGFYAAMLFMMAAAWYNVTVAGQNQQLQSRLAAANQQTKDVVDQANQQLHQLQAINQEITAALATFTPDVKYVAFLDAQKKPFASAWLNESSKRALLVLPAGVVAGNTGQLVLENNNSKIVYQANVLAAPNSMLTGTAPNDISNRAPLVMRNLVPDVSNPKVSTATLAPQ